MFFNSVRRHGIKNISDNDNRGHYRHTDGYEFQIVAVDRRGGGLGPPRPGAGQQYVDHALLLHALARLVLLLPRRRWAPSGRSKRVIARLLDETNAVIAVGSGAVTSGITQSGCATAASPCSWTCPPRWHGAGSKSRPVTGRWHRRRAPSPTCSEQRHRVPRHRRRAGRRRRLGGRRAAARAVGQAGGAGRTAATDRSATARAGGRSRGAARRRAAVEPFVTMQLLRPGR